MKYSIQIENTEKASTPFDRQPKLKWEWPLALRLPLTIIPKKSLMPFKSAQLPYQCARPVT
jgi:hypothetical protein